MAKLAGYRTYVVVALMVIKVAVDAALGHGLNTELLLEALALAGLRASIK